MLNEVNNSELSGRNTKVGISQFTLILELGFLSSGYPWGIHVDQFYSLRRKHMLGCCCICSTSIIGWALAIYECVYIYIYIYEERI